METNCDNVVSYCDNVLFCSFITASATLTSPFPQIIQKYYLILIKSYMLCQLLLAQMLLHSHNRLLVAVSERNHSSFVQIDWSWLKI